jgi:hypothetical protein
VNIGDLPTVWRLRPSDRPGRGAIPLRRRGILHGHLIAEPATDESATSELQETWRAAEPILLPGILAPALAPLGEAIAASRALFERLRRGARFLPEVLAALEDASDFRPEGSTFDRLDAREIEKVFVAPRIDGRRGRSIGEVWAKLAWVAHDERDRSLRVRFSCGTEQLHDWHDDVTGQIWSDRLAQALFPECTAIADNVELAELIAELLGAPPRFSERIVYSNAPGGGAVFHHDVERTQRGVVYGQLQGATAWLALPVCELARQIVAHGVAGAPKTIDDALRRLDRDDDAVLFALLNNDPTFTARLAHAGWLCVLEAGDALLLPSHDRERVAWHSVFALGSEPSLAHSYGVFTASDPGATPTDP